MSREGLPTRAERGGDVDGGLLKSEGLSSALDVGVVSEGEAGAACVLRVVEPRKICQQSHQSLVQSLSGPGSETCMLGEGEIIAEAGPTSLPTISCSTHRSI